MNLYECDFCIANKLYEGRACFLDKFPGNKSYTFELPVFDDVSPYPTESTNEELDMEGVLEKLVQMEWEKPDAPPFELLQTYFASPEVCVTSLSDESIDLIALEQSSRDYHSLPFGGGILDQPKALMTSFSIIASERNQWERIRMERTDRKMRQEQMKNRSKQRQQLGGRPGGPMGPGGPNRG